MTRPAASIRPATAPARAGRRRLLAAVGTAALAASAMPVARAQAWPSKPIRLVVVYPTGGVSDSVARLLAPRLAERLGTPVVVENKGGAQVITDAVGGQFELLTTNPSSAVNQFVARGTPRLLAVGAPKRLDSHPDVPTLAELGQPEANLTSTFGLFAPAATPAPVVQRVADEIARLLAQPELRQRLLDTDNVPAALGPAEFGALVRREHETDARIVKAANIRAE